MSLPPQRQQSWPSTTPRMSPRPRISPLRR